MYIGDPFGRLERASAGAELTFWEIDTLSRRVSLSASWAQFMGDASAELNVALEYLQSLVHADDLPEVVEAYGAALRGVARRYEVTYRVRIVDGSHRRVMSRGQITERDAAGRPLRLSGTTIDITQQRKAAIDKLPAADSHVDDANKATRDFLARASHAIRTPMNGMIGTLEVLESSALQSGQVELVRMVRESAADLMAVANQLLDFSAVESGRLQLLHAPVDLRDLVDKSSSLFRGVAARNGIELSTSIDGALNAQYMADEHRMREVLQNLISNALKFTDKGRVALGARLLSCRPADDLVEFHVSDTGVGLSEADRTRLFEPFVQAGPGAGGRRGGSGLGLSICRGLVTAMGGEIGIRSELGTGTTVSFMLPLRRAEEVRPG